MLFTAKRGDWCDFWSNEEVSVWWNRLCDNVLLEKTMPFDLRMVLPTRLDKDVAGLLFLLRRLTRRGINAACGQCSASGRARDGRFYRSWLASVTVYASPSPFSDERPSSRFRGISSPSKRRRLRYSTVGLTRYRTRRAAYRQRGTGATGAPSRCPL